MNTNRFYLPLLSMVALVGCASAPSGDGTSLGQSREADRIGPGEEPTDLIPGASARLADNILPADIGKTFGTDDAHVPYPDSYWPFMTGGIDEVWNETEPSPLEKYETAFSPQSLSAAKVWEDKNHGRAVPGVQGWYGHCPGWAGASMATVPLAHAVKARADGHGGVKACADGEAGCTTFQIGDVNALAAEVFVDAAGGFLGARCDTKPADIKRDEYGRIVRNGTGCKGLNAGALLIVLGQRMKKAHQAIAIDAQNSYNTDQIWNQPAYRYSVYRYEPVTEAEASNLVASGKRTGTLVHYPWDTAAKGFALVDIGIQWVSERGPNLVPVSGALSTRETRFVAVIELSGAPSAADTRILGGEYIEDPTVYADRLTVPPFVWTAEGPGPESLPTYVNGNNHNPYVAPSIVLRLIAMGS